MALSLAIVEASHWHTDIHVEAFLSAGCQLVGVSDRSDTARSDLASRFNCPVFSDPLEMIDSVHPDLAVVLGRHSEMPQLALEVAATGVPFVLEKPCAVSATALQPVVDFVAERNLFAAVPLANRYRDLWQQESITQPAYGHFRIVTGSVNRYLEWGVPWVLDPAVSGGGALRNIGIHPVDAFLSIADSDTVEVLGSAIRDHPDYPGIDVRSVALLSAGSAVGVIEATYTFPDDRAADVEWRIESGDRYVRDRNTSYEIADTAGVERVERIELPSRYQRFAIDVCERLERGAAPEASLVHAYRALKVIDAIYQNGRGEVGHER